MTFEIAVDTRQSFFDDYQEFFEGMLAVDKRLVDVFVACLFLRFADQLGRRKEGKEIFQFVYELSQFNESCVGLRSSSGGIQLTDTLMKLKVIAKEGYFDETQGDSRRRIL